ncbi:MAG: ShlB/FhaC/HecB family hemolysin secretion/activation protein [Pseudomonadota bacterium]
MPLKPSAIGCFITLWLGAGFAFAQDAALLEAEAQRQQRQQQERERQQAQQLQPTLDVRLSDPAATPAALALPDEESPCFVIHTLHIDAAQPHQQDWAWLHAHIGRPGDRSAVVGSCLGVQGVGVVLARLQQVLVGRGYITTRVTAPPQNLASGALHLRVHEGVVSQIRFADGHGERATRFNTLPIRAGDVLNLRDLEQGLENLKRVPTVQADFAIEPGAEPGQSELVLRHQQAFPFRVHASLDDAGSPSTGRLQGSITLSYDNWWTLSDLFYITLHTAVGGKDPGPRGNRGHTVHYSVPWGYNLWSFNRSQSRHHQTVAGALQNYIYSGTSVQHDVRLARVVQRDQAGKTTAAVRAFHRRSRNFIDDTEVQVQRRAVSGLDLSLGHRRSLGAGQWEAQLTHRQGIKAWGALPAPEEAFGEGTAQMRLWLLDAQLSQPFQLGGLRLAYQGRLRGQWHQTPLTPQDRFAIGGRYTVRGFDGHRVLAADSGVLLRNELSTRLGASPYSLYAGLDWGRVSGPAAQALVGRELTGAVLGLRAHWQMGRVRTQIDWFAGRPLEHPAGFQASNRVYGFSLHTQF